MTYTDFNFRREIVALTKAQIAANIAAAPMPDGWTAAHDVALWNDLYLGLRLDAIADRIGQMDQAVSDRFKALKEASGAVGRAMTIEEQRAVLEIVRGRA